MNKALLLICAAAALGGCGRPAAPPASGTESTTASPATDSTPDVVRIEPGMLRDLRMTTAMVEQRSSGTEIDMLGEIDVNRDAYAEVAAPIEAQIVRLLASPNQRIRDGDPLAELRSPELGRARAELDAAQARSQLAAQAVQRKRTLAAERIVAARELEEAEAQLAETQAAVNSAGAALRALGAEPTEPADSQDPSRFVLRSPLTGTVLERNAALGQLASTSTALFTVANLNRVWLNVHAFERDAVQLRARTPVRVTLAAMPGREFTGIVTLVGQRVDASSRTVDVRAELTNTDGLLRPGMSAIAHVPLQTDGQTVLAVPAAAVQRVGEEWVVFTPNGEGTFNVRRIGRGRDLGGEVEVAQGLSASDTVVVEGAFLLKAEAEKALGGNHEEHE